MNPRPVALTLVTAVLVLTSACSSSGSGGSSNSGAGAGVLRSGDVDPATASAAKSAAEAAGKPVELPKKTIGFVAYGVSGAASQRVQTAAEQAAKALGWDLKTCDGANVPATQASCATNLVNQGVDGLMLNTLPQAGVTAALQSAKAKGIPVVNVGGDNGQRDMFDASYFPSEDEMGAAMADYIVKKLGPEGGPMVVQTFPADFATQRVAALEKTIAGTKVTIAQTFDADATNLVPGTQQQVSAALNGHPDAKAVWITFSGSELGASQAMQTLHPGKQFPDRPLITSFYANLPTLDLIRGGQLDAATENALEWTSWVALDQLAEQFTRQAAFSQEPRPDYGSGLDFWRPVVVTSDNLPKAGELATPPVDFIGFFDTKWQTEFTNLAK